MIVGLIKSGIIIILQLRAESSESAFLEEDAELPSALVFPKPAWAHGQ